MRDSRTKRLYEHWLAKKGNRRAPRREDFQPEDFPDLLSSVFLVDVVGNPRRFRLRLVGTSIVTEYGQELTGRYMDEIDFDGVLTKVLEAYEEATRDWVPVMHHVEFTKDDARHLTYERVILPLSSIPPGAAAWTRWDRSSDVRGRCGRDDSVH